jgi:surface polysaccharide O-acyltransferase-like enzyme
VERHRNFRYVTQLMSDSLRRKYFLDWLRVIAFVILIVFHTGLLYSTWHYNLKSPRILPSVEWALLALTPWRLALLFFISGVASYHLLAKLGRGAFARDRLRRLLPVVLVGMFIVIPPQTYVELVDKGVLHSGYFEFWFGSYLAADQSLVAPLGKTMPTWDHLWFIVYLLAYLLVLALVAPVAHLASGRRWPTVRFSVIIVAPAIWLAFAEVMIERYAPLTHAFANDWGGHLKWIGMLITGFVCATRPDFWDWCLRKRARLAVLAALAFAVQSACRAWAGARGVDPPAEDVLLALASGVYAWSVICALCGYAAQYLDTPSRQLSHLNEAILPVYVLHQPILLITAWLLFPIRLPLLIEAGLLIAAALLGSLAVHELLIRPWPLVRPLFGLKSKLGITVTELR